MTDHCLHLDVQNGKLIASCACGNWRREHSLDHIERPSELFRRLEEEYQRHVAGDPGS
jgi:hypothetical protein